jgi:hypothetical protein
MRSWRFSKVAVVMSAVVGAAMLSPSAAHAAINASISYTAQKVNAGYYQYSATLTNTGDTNIGTFWFGWVVYPPIYDLLPSLPINVAAPAGWTGAGLNDSFYGGYSAEWTTPTSPLPPGQSLSGFTFLSTDSPALMANTSPVFGLFRADTSWVYVGASQADPGLRVQPTQIVPEPMTGALSATLLLPLLMRPRSRGH